MNFYQFTTNNMSIIIKNTIFSNDNIHLISSSNVSNIGLETSL